MAHKKGPGSSRNGRDSQPKMLGVKRFAGQFVSGGDGGEGGSVYVVATRRLNTLYHLQFHREWRAGRGQHGMGSNCSGQHGGDVIIELPVGSVVRDKNTGVVLADLTQEGQRVLV